MTKETIKILCLFAGAIGLFIGCEQRNNIDLSKTPKFKPYVQGKYIPKFISYNVDAKIRRSDTILRNTLGVYKDPVFGKLKSSIALSFSLAKQDVHFGKNPILDSVVLVLPLLKRNSRKTPFVNDSIFGFKSGNSFKPFELKVYELTERILPNKSYSSNYSVKYNKSAIHKGLMQFSQDSIEVVNSKNKKRVKVEPSIRIKLDKEFFKRKIVDKSGQLELVDNARFKNYFFGLYLTADSEDGAIASFTTLTLQGSKVKGNLLLYYRNEKGKLLHLFPISAKAINVFEHDRTASDEELKSNLNNPDSSRGESTIYLQGLNGVNGKIVILSDEDIKRIKKEKWIINQAIITMPVEQNNDGLPIPNELQIWKENTDRPVIDVLRRIPTYGGFYDSKNKNYVFRITRHVNDIVYRDSTNTPLLLNVKRPTSSPFRVKINGNANKNPMKFEIFYTKN